MAIPKVFIIILNWNNYNDTKECLESLKNLDYKNYEVIIVDNGSEDKSSQKLEKEYPQHIYIYNHKNLGFAGGNNVGINYAVRKRCDFILLLNNDTVVDSDFLNKMVKTAQRYNAGIVGAKIYYFNDPKRIWFAGGKFIWWRASGKHYYWRKLDSPKLSGAADSDFITGCAMLIRKEVFNDVGLLYGPYFLTVEDLDFCYFARRNGWQIRVNLNAKIWHKVSFSRMGEFSFSNGYYGIRNRLFFAFKRTKNYIGGVVLLIFVVPIRTIQWLFQGKHQMLKGLLLGIRDFFKGKMGPLKSL